MIPAYKRVTKRAEMIIAGAYLAGTNTRRVRRALQGLFGARIGKDTVRRAWRKVQADWEAWLKRDISGEDIVLILYGTVVKVRLDRQATNICLPVVMGVRRDGQKVLLAVRTMGGESEAAWREVLDDLVAVAATNAIERLHEEFKRRIKTQCVLPSAETAAMLFWALLAAGQITLRRVDGWRTLDQEPSKEPWLAMAA